MVKVDKQLGTFLNRTYYCKHTLAILSMTFAIRQQDLFLKKHTTNFIYKLNSSFLILRTHKFLKENKRLREETKKLEKELTMAEAKLATCQTNERKLVINFH